MVKTYKLFGLITLWRVTSSVVDEDKMYERMAVRFNKDLAAEIKRRGV